MKEVLWCRLGASGGSRSAGTQRLQFTPNPGTDCVELLKSLGRWRVDEIILISLQGGPEQADQRAACQLVADQRETGERHAVTQDGRLDRLRFICEGQIRLGTKIGQPGHIQPALPDRIS